MVEKHIIKCVGNRRLVLSALPDDKLSIMITKGPLELAHLVLDWQEMYVLRNALQDIVAKKVKR